MSKLLFTLTLLAALSHFTTAQDGKISPLLTARDNPQPFSAGSHTEPTMASSPSSNLPFCPPKTCLYYGGDFESSNSGADGLLNAHDTGGSNGPDGQVWVGVKPAKRTSITGSTFNEFFTSGFIGTNPTSFQAQTGITTGNAGKLICNTSGNATMKLYGEGDFGFNQYSYTVKKLKKACKVQVGKRGATYVNMLPTSANGYGFLANTDGTNHKGWSNDPNDCYFNDVPFDLHYVSCSTQGTFTLMSIALTGTE